MRRWFSQSLRTRNEPLLAALKDKHDQVLILLPQVTKDKTLASWAARTGKPKGSKLEHGPVKNLAFDADEQTVPSVFAGIESFRSPPDSPANSAQLIRQLSASFTKPQLASYTETYAKDLHRKSYLKAKLAELIVAKVWNRPQETSAHIKEQISLSRMEMFLLLSQRGLILRMLQRAVALVDFDAAENQLLITGTPKQLQNAQIFLANTFNNAVKEEIDLSPIAKLYEEKFGSFSFKDIGGLTEVYFNHLHGNTYELCAFSPSQIKRIKRLLIWHLDYNLHKRESLYLPESSVMDKCSVLPHIDEYGMPWKNRSQRFGRLQVDTHSASPSLVAELEKFSAERLNALLQNLDVDDFSALPSEQAMVEKETLDLLSSLGIYDEPAEVTEESSDANSEISPDSEQAAWHDADVEVESPESDLSNSELAQPDLHKPEPSAGISLISSTVRDRIFQDLNNTVHHKNLAGLPDHSLESPMYTVTLGKVLFGLDKKDSAVLDVQPKATLSNATFSSNVTLAYDNMLALALAGEEGTSLETDPHVYMLQFKFLPSPYSDQSPDHLRYPPVEVWMSLNERKIPDLESLQVVTVESENLALVCLPEKASDLKVTSQLTGSLLAPAIDAETSAEDIKGLFEKTSSKYTKLEGQAGLQKFLDELDLDFSGRRPTSIAQTVDFVIDGKTVQYAFVSLNFRQELIVEVDDGSTAQLSIVDGGLLGGRRVEVRFIGEPGSDRAYFDEVLDQACKFVDAM